MKMTMTMTMTMRRIIEGKMRVLYSCSPRLAVSCREDVSIRDEHPAALVLGEEAEPGGLLDEHLPRRDGDDDDDDDYCDDDDDDDDDDEDDDYDDDKHLPGPVAEL